jgi:hypothetical protein
MMHDWSE